MPHSVCNSNRNANMFDEKIKSSMLPDELYYESHCRISHYCIFLFRTLVHLQTKHIGGVMFSMLDHIGGVMFSMLDHIGGVMFA